MNIIIPSYKRSHDLPGKDYFYMAKYCIPESQQKEYENVLGKDRVITLPDSEDGNIVKKRNWILKNISRPLVMIDDDVKYISYYEKRTGRNDGNQRPKILDKNILNDIFNHYFDLSEQLGCYMWGMSQNEDNRIYKEYMPFNLSSIILGPFQAHLKHDLIFDNKMGTKEDYDMSFQQLKKYGKILRTNKLHYICKHGDNKGGIVSYRSKEKEIEYCKNIMAKWGRGIIEYRIPPRKLTDLLNAKKVNIPIKGI